MPRSARLRPADVRAVYLLANECRDLGDDAVAWRQHLLAGLCPLVGAGLGAVGELSGVTAGPRQGLGYTDWGWHNGFDRGALVAMVSTFHTRDKFYNPLMNAGLARLPAHDAACWGRADLIPDDDWYGGAYFRDLHRPMGADHTACSFARVSTGPDDVQELYLFRPAGEPDFSARDKAVLAEAQSAVARLVGGPLARFADPSPAALPARARQVLWCLLEGDGDKQVAARLGLRPHTVNGYVKVIFAHFGVSSRPELLARWVRRGWGNRGAWADDA